jgi:hypothetical protein
MSAFDNLKLAMIPSGFKEDKLYSVIPFPNVTGNELVTNGDFSNGVQNWTLVGNTSLNNGVISYIDDGSNTNSYILQQNTINAGSLYKLSFDVTRYNSGLIQIETGTDSGGGVPAIDVDISQGVGSYHAYLNANNAFFLLKRNGSSPNFDFDIDNISAKEVDQLPADFTFSRGSDSTRVNPQGLVESVQILGSNVITTGDFDSQSDVDFWQIAETSGTPRATKTLENGFMRLTFDLANGSALFKGGTTVPLGRYKVTFRAKGTANSNFRSIGDNNSIQDNPEYAILNPTLTSEFQNYEFVIDLTSTSFRLYLASAQVGNTLDIDDIVILPITDDTDIPRLDYSDGTCPSLLLEPQRTNLFTTSIDFDGASALNSTLTTVSITSPEGLTIGVHEVTATSTSQPRIEEFLTVPTGDKKYVWSVFVKKNTARYVGLSHFNQNSNRCIFDLDNGTIVSDNGTDVAAKIQNFGNGWFRISKGANIPSGSEAGSFKVHLCTETDVFTGVNGESAYFFGLQIERGDYVSSYIPTRGTTVTRDTDVCGNAGDSTIFNDTEGVLYAEIAALADDLTFRVISISDNTNDNVVKFGYRSDSQNIYYEVRSGNVSQAFGKYQNTNITEFHKVAVKYKQNDFALYVNGVEVLSDSSGITPVGLSQIDFKVGIASNIFIGKTKSLLYFDTALTDSQLSDLTS